MTIEIKIQSSPDAFANNALIALKREMFCGGVALAASEWTTERTVSADAFLGVLGFVFARATQRLEGYGIWLLTGDTAWQTDTRIVRYRKRFNALKMRGIDFETIPDRFEWEIESAGKLKFFGVVRLDQSVLPLVQLAMTPRSCTYIVALPHGREQNIPRSSAWSGQWNEDSHLVEMIGDSNGIAFQRTGFFDDREVGLLALGSPTALEKIAV